MSEQEKINAESLGFNIIPPSEICVDDDLALRTLSIADAEALFEITDDNRAELHEWLPWVDSTLSAEDSRNFITSVIEKRDNLSEAPYGIFYKGKLSGHTSLMSREGDVGEIGYWLDKAVYGKGLATKAAEALTKLGFDIG